MKKSLIMTTAAVAGLGVAATTQTVFATEAPTENTVNSTINNKVTDKDLSDAEKRAVDTAKDADKKAKDAEQAKDTLDKAQKDKDAKTAEKDALEKDLEKAKDATPEKIKDETDDVDAKEKAKADKETESNKKADQVTKKSDEAKLAKDELDKARTGVEKADKELKDATDDFDPTAKDKAQQEKDDADKDVLVKDQAKRNAETELEKAKEDDKTREAKKVQERQNKNDKEAEKTAKEGDVKTAEKAIKDAEEKLKSAQYPTDVVLTPEWRDKAKELIKRRMDKYPEPYPDMTGMDADQIDKADEEWNARYNVWLEQYRKDIRRLEEELTELDRETNENWMDRISKISETGIQDGETDVKYDPNNLPQDIVDDLNNHFVTLLNSLRKQLGLSEAKLNTNNKDFAKEVAKIYKDNDYQDLSHFGRGINDIARKRGLKPSEKPGIDTHTQYYEDLMNIPMGSDKMTKQELLARMTESFMSFFAEGYLTGGYGHFYSLLQADTVGLNTSIIKGGQLLTDLGDPDFTHVYRIHVLKVKSEKYIDNDNTDIQKAKYDDLYGPNSKANLPTPTLQSKQEVEAELEKAKSDKKTAEANLEQVKTELQEIEKRITDLEKEVSETPAKEAKRAEAVKELEKAKEKAEDAQRKLERATLDDNAKSLRLEKARKEKDEADKELAKKLAESQQKDKDLEDAKIERLKADKELKDAEDALQKAKDKLAETLHLSQEKAKLEAELKAKSKELDELCKHVDDLKRDVKQKEDEAEKARKIKDEAEREYQKLLLHKTIDDALIPEQPEFKGGVNGPGAIQPELPEFPLDELPKDEEPKVEEPKVEQPRVEQPKVDEPKGEQPKVEQPKAEQPKVAQPKGEEPAQELKSGRSSDEPNTEKPGQAGNRDVKPVGPAPSYQAPAVLSQAKQEVEQKALPNTGSQVSLLALLGYGLLAGLGIILKKKRDKN
ncbi:SEC10/PgrA surface exclusion domain-containing protein [Streptococcus sp. 3705]|uniref:SEC10/PgrA surface exclusion domain-containing protein n=1 Tax=Streptococcus sp. 3705 TaxID=2582651 RepID=UPI001566C1FD|nr:SEC10/PgrA surface exclusion domain-containing protein [Streptococcus sp. 3705]